VSAADEPQSTARGSNGEDMTTTDQQQRRKALRDAFIDQRGYWSPAWDGVLDLDPEFFAAYLHLASVPGESGVLEPKVKEFIHIAVDAAATHLYVPGIRDHIKRALTHGATGAEIMEVIELTSTLGIHAANIGVPILVEELEAAGHPIDRALSERQAQVKAEFTQKRGYWNAFWDDMLALDCEFFAAYTEFSSVPWVSGTLEPKVKEFIYTAFDVAATHLYVKGLRQHIRNALGYGASREEVLEVIEIASLLGIHAATVGVPILIEELAAAGEDGS
jgi:alkylhydroperoxidase/carboxymuconolactone decarboxylase family protein YurZ